MWSMREDEHYQSQSRLGVKVMNWLMDSLKWTGEKVHERRCVSTLSAQEVVLFTHSVNRRVDAVSIAPTITPTIHDGFMWCP